MAGREPWFSMTQRELDLVCPQLNGSEWKAYTALASCRNAKTMETPPVGISLVMGKTGLSKRTAFRSIESMERSGLLLKRSCGNRAVYGFPRA